MKTLYLIRHAKAMPVAPSMRDRDRPLDTRGEHDAKALGKRLHHDKVHVDRIISSPARRALSTARIVAHKLVLEEKNIAIDDRIYASDPDTLLRIIMETPPEVGSLMVFGHNPEFSELAQRFCDELGAMPTCSLARFRFDVDSWKDIEGAVPVDAYLETP
ncbi:MAG: histidine phosphatase family protein [Burkholderiaceae bacterium]|jgi:phosphohistidine phosphatase|nr:histidine phosphatase family protein [Burkholderiaceae bacterium]